MRIVDLLTDGGARANRDRHYECRECGANLGAEAEQCSECGGEVAIYTL